MTAQEVMPALQPLPPGMPALVAEAGPAAQFAWEEFLAARISNPHTRAAYSRALARFLAWVQPKTPGLAQVTPAQVGAYIAALPGRPATRKLHLSALRSCFDLFVERHVMVLNPAASVRGERYQAVEGRTPELPREAYQQLMASLDLTKLGGLRDRAILATLAYTAVRVGAVARLQLGDLVWDGTQHQFRFHEKGGKQREIPVRHDLQEYLLAYLEAGDLKEAPPKTPFFRALAGRRHRLTDRGVTAIDLSRMLRRRLKAAGLALCYSPHSFRVTTLTNLLEQGAALEDVQHLAGHADPRVTRLYDRRPRRITRNLVERISL